MKKIILILIFICLVHNSSYSQGKSDTNKIRGVQLIISTDKSDYLEGENVWLERILIVDKKVKLDYRPYYHREFVTNSKNKEFLDNNGDIHVLGISYDYPDTIYNFYVLNFGILEKVQNLKYYYFAPLYFPAEEYEITAFENVVIKGKTYKVEANPVKFTVHIPEGDELSARKQYLEFIPLIINDTINYKSIVEKVDSFMVNYENSVYVEKVFELTKLSYYHFVQKSPDDLIEFNYNQILKHPDFADNYFRLLYITTAYDNKKDLGGYLSLIYDLETKLKDNVMFKKVLFHHKLAYKMELKQGIFK